MKKLILILAMASTSAFAQHHHGGGGDRWIGPALIGGIIGYELSQRPQQVIIQPPVYTQPPVYINLPQVYNLPTPRQNGATPIYEKRSQFDFNCNCYVVVYNQIGWQ